MASIELREELNCSICLNIFTDPVNLTCGHNFCRACIDSVFDKQKVTGGYSCPECRIKFKKRPGLQRNITLCNVVRHFHSAPEPEMKASGIFCTYCIHSAVAAVKSCLLCEASLCHDHLRVHNKSPEHVLSDPTACPEDRKCSIHKRILEYYCTEDSTCVCATCCLLGEHKGHRLESLKEISEKKKEKLKADLEELTTETSDIERKVQILKEYQIKETERAADLTKRVSTILLDLKRQMEVQLTKVLRDVNYKEDCISYSVSGILDQLEAKRASLACKMSQISELHNSSDPLAVLQYRKSSVDDSSDMKDKNEKLPGSVDEMLSGVGDMKVDWFLEELKASLANIIKGINIWIFKPEPEDLTLDVHTAANNVLISDDLRTATWSENCPNHPETPERFEKYQVLSV
ncbi:E3 ubiquitin/ISG15 ligase TRIM25-like [Hyperolius riggenbachi]|uniref:E3 ubiquitin/ISG15 ligase TRIM25-like n=1 Tax=Hyperolius riggenbachi TaxID=752182 RepID=UPI0035A29A28